MCGDRCFAFTANDALHMRAQGWNFVRLGVIWAGGQPTAAPELDADFERRLHDFLDLAHEHGLHVVLDVHEDSVGTATCGEGVPPWLSALATPGQVGKPLTPLFTEGVMYANEASWVPDATQQQCQEKTLAACAAKGLWDGKCWTNDTGTWALYAGETDYNIKNPCCMRYNGGGSQWSRLAVTEQGQSTMKYLLSNPEGRAHYARYIGLLARAVKDYPAAIGIELMNVSPPTSFPSSLASFQLGTTPLSRIRCEQEPPVSDMSPIAKYAVSRVDMYTTWKACYDAVRAEVPELAVGVMDAGEGVWSVDRLEDGSPDNGMFGLNTNLLQWLRSGDHLFYAYHQCARAAAPFWLASAVV